MTTRIKIEIAEHSSHTVSVDVLEPSGGEDQDLLVEHHKLSAPGEVKEVIIWGDRYIFVQEMPADPQD